MCDDGINMYIDIFLEVMLLTEEFKRDSNKIDVNQSIVL